MLLRNLDNFGTLLLLWIQRIQDGTLAHCPPVGAVRAVGLAPDTHGYRQNLSKASTRSKVSKLSKASKLLMKPQKLPQMCSECNSISKLFVFDGHNVHQPSTYPTPMLSLASTLALMLSTRELMSATNDLAISCHPIGHKNAQTSRAVNSVRPWKGPTSDSPCAGADKDTWQCINLIAA